MKPSLVSLGALAALVPLVSRAPLQEGERRPGLRRVDPALEDPAPAPDLGELLAGPLDRERWRAELASADLDRRERVLDLLVARARLDPVTRAWVEELARAPEEGELAWTARLALRELGRARFPLGGRGTPADPLDLFGEMERRMQELFSRVHPNLLVPNRSPRGGGGSARGSRSVHVEQGSHGARVRITESVDGEEVLRAEHTGADLGAILRANPGLERELGGLRMDVEPGSLLDLRLDLGAERDGAVVLEDVGRLLGPRGGLTLVPGGRSRPIVTDKLGVNVEPLAAARARELGLDGRGLLVLRAVPQTYAHLLGVVAGDVLVELDGRPLRADVDIEAAMQARDADAPLTLVWIDRLGQRREKTWHPADRR